MKQYRQGFEFGKYPFVYILSFLIGGILAYNFYPVNQHLMLALFVLLFSVSLLLLFLKKKKEPQLLQTPIIFTTLFLSGYVLAQQTDPTQNPLWIGHQAESTDYLWGQIKSTPELKSKTTKLTVRLTQSHATQWIATNGELFIYLFNAGDNQTIQEGDYILFPNKLNRITNRGNPFEFDYAAYLGRKGIAYQAFLSPKEISIIHNQKAGKKYLGSLRKHLLHALESNIHDTATIALAEATLLNDRTLLDNAIYQAYSVTGIAHIIAISGLHVSLFFSIILAVLVWIKSPQLRWIKYLLGLPVIWFYVAITNFPPSAVRAAVMFSLLFISLALKRSNTPINTLAATAFLLLCFRPNWLYDTGVQLSFAAVASIFIFAQPVQKLWEPKTRILKYLWGLIAITISVQILVFPVVLYYFHQFPLWVFLANLPAAPFSLFLMIMGLLLFILDGLGIPTIWLGDIMSMVTKYFHHIIFFFADNTPQAMRQISITGTEFWIITLATIFLTLFIFYKRISFLYGGLSFIILLFSIFLFKDFQFRKQQKFIVFNSNNLSLIDYYSGKICYSLATNKDSVPKPVYQNVLIPARLGFGIQNISSPNQTSAIKKINGKTILFLDNDSVSFSKKTSFPVDYLILSSKAKISVRQLKGTFKSEQIILDGSFSRWKGNKLKEKLLAENFKVHFVIEDGAWVFPK